ncbi:lipopolysaccharide biosynthesis protein [Ekhidna sp. To15]|uniref:lipopolysaccharide biosynthesis protein n=1 Tax=Ekhidna sp. To15 TaxID=3395267 RepID=UPI003F52878F
MKVFDIISDRKFKVVTANSLRNIVVPITGISISLLTIANSSIEIWGEFVNYQIVIGIVGTILSFGSNEFLLRKFSKEPSKIRESWQSNVSSRIPLLILGIGFLRLIYSQSESVILPFLILWLIFNYINKTFDPLVLYKKLFLQATIIEVVLLSFSVAYLLFIDTIDTYQLCFLYSTISIVRFILLLPFLYTDTFRSFRFLWDIENTKGAVSFFMSSITGMLNSRIDLYLISLTLSNSEVGAYQVITSFLLHLQSVAGFTLSPFVKNIYRTSIKVNFKLSKKLFLTGLLITIGFMPVFHLILSELYLIEIDWIAYLIFIPYVTPIFYSLPIIYLLYKNEKERTVTMVNVAKLIFNAALIMILIPIYGILGALLACAISNILVSGYYGISRNRLQSIKI